MKSKVILYGAGDIGKDVYDFLKFQGNEDLVYCFCDKTKTFLEEDNITIYTYDKVKNLGYPFIISVQESSDAYAEIEDVLKRDKREYYRNLRAFQEAAGLDMEKFERDVVAYSHINNSWFDAAENKMIIDIFWGVSSVFYERFQKLDLSHILEFACGHGRHVSHYIDYSEHVTLVDVLQDNISFCKERFGENHKISYYCNNGYDLCDVCDESVTAIFSYDSMVHFDMININEYLKEFHRVLQSGGLALLHHSNLHSHYDITFKNGIHNRNYMSAELFSHLAYMNGFEIADKIVIDWFGIKDLDCITLLRKP